LKNNPQNTRRSVFRSLILLLALMAFINSTYGQAEVEPWGNITGIRHKGQLYEFESGIRIQRGNDFTSTGQERQHPHYKRVGDEQIINTNIDSLFIDETVEDEGGDKVKVTITLNAHADYNFDGAFFTVQLPHTGFADGKQRLEGGPAGSKQYAPAGQNFDGTVKGAQFKSSTMDISVNFDDGPAVVRIRKDISSTGDPQLYVAMKQNGMSKGEVIQKTFIIKASGDVDHEPVNLAINTSRQGREFDGLGGNFRLQNPKFDPEVIDYCLENMRVAYGRVELPWRFWQPGQHVDPTAAANSGKLNPAVKKAMQMAHRLDSLGIPFILTAWFPPNWAIVGKPNYRPVNGVWGNPLNKDSLNATYKSISDYILYLKSKYGAEPKYFSFNESDLGINVRITPQEHDNFIKGCGAYFAAHGVSAKMLLGDNSDATTYHFIDIAMNDPAAKPYIGAISFHSWRGCDDATLQHWADAAIKLNLPLLVGEGSIDAAASIYPDIFKEPTYALKEINLYTRLLARVQPESILQWQLTADYSPLIGGGIFGDNEPMHPGQRFWNLKQLASTPAGLFAMPITCDRPNISVAALGDNTRNIYAIHMVNTGAKRKVELTGLPATVKKLQVFTTSGELNMKDEGTVKVKNGKAKFKVEATSFTSLVSQ
jgi:O-glycosyl hydrolase